MVSRIGIACAVALGLLALACGKHTTGDGGLTPEAAEWLDELREGVASSVSDPNTATKLVSKVDDIEGVLRNLDADTRAYYAKLYDLSADYDASREEFLAVAGDFNETIAAQRSRIVDLCLAMKALCTEDEWAAITDYDKSLLEVWQRNPTVPKP